MHSVLTERAQEARASLEQRGIRKAALRLEAARGLDTDLIDEKELRCSR